MPPWDLLERTRRFAVDVLKFCRRLPATDEARDECVDWLANLQDGQIEGDAALLQEAKELASILATAVRTAHRNVKST